MASQKERVTASRAFLEGLAHIFDPFSNIESGHSRKTVNEQLQEDWETIARDMRKVLPNLEPQDKETIGS